MNVEIKSTLTKRAHITRQWLMNLKSQKLRHDVSYFDHTLSIHQNKLLRRDFDNYEVKITEMDMIMTDLIELDFV